MKYNFLLIILCSFFGLTAQITVDPAFPLTDDVITLTYDAALGNAALVGSTPIYIHTGVITSNSVTPNDWQHVIGDWGTADNTVLMTDLGNNKHEITFNIRNFYGVPMSETVINMAAVFRNQAGDIVGRAGDGSDLFYPVFDGNFVVNFTAPTDNFLIKTTGEMFDVTALSSASADLELLHDGLLVSTSTTDSLTETITANGPGNHEIIIRGDNGITASADTIKYVVNPPASSAFVPAGTTQGINVINSSTIRLYLYAPDKEFVYVVGDFNNWELNTDYLMNKTPNGKGYWIDINGLSPIKGYRFQYLVDGEILIADPYSPIILDQGGDAWIPQANFPDLPDYPFGSTSGHVSYVDPGASDYVWSNTTFERPDKKEMVIYELLVRDFTNDQSFQSILNRIDYLEDLGVNAIEFMPVNEFEGNNSWGYNPSFHTAVDKYYGSPDKFKELVDSCHAKGMAVIMDVVLNHAFSQSPFCKLYWDEGNFRPAIDNVWLNPVDRHPFGVGYDFNHESNDTKFLTNKVLSYWINEYNIDGYRFDLSKGFTQTLTNDIGAWSNYDASRVNLLGDMASTIRATDPDVILILEHFANNDEETVLANDYDFLLWGNLNHEYNEAAMGYSSNLSYGLYNDRGWNEPNLVTFMESHDEERIMFKNLEYGNSNGSYDITDLPTALDRNELAAALFIPLPGPKMIWQFGELGYDYSIELCPDGTFDNDCRIDEKPVRWDYYADQDRKDLYEVYRNLIHLKTNYETFQTTNFWYSLDGPVKSVQLYHSDFDAIVVGNFDVSQRNVDITFTNTGTWYEYFTQSSLQVNNASESFQFEAGEYRLYTNVEIDKLLPADLDTTMTGINSIEIDNSSFRVYPNPTNDFVFIQNDGKTQENVSIKMYDLNGRIVVSKELNLFNNGAALKMDLSTELVPGAYLIKIQSEVSLSTQKLLIN